MVKYRTDVVKPIYEQIVNVLLSRLDEREESIKTIVLSIFTEMVKGIVLGDASEAKRWMLL